MDLTTGADSMTCPACHHPMQPEYRAWANLERGVVLRARCGRCGRLWQGILNQPRQEDLSR